MPSSSRTRRRRTSGCCAPPTGRSRSLHSRGEAAPMARRRKKRTLKPRLPARVKKTTRKRGRRSEQHPELLGLALVALGLFLASILYLGWNGGTLGGGIAGAFTGAVGTAAYVTPIVFVAIGALMVARSALVDVSPFRTGLAVAGLGLLTTLGGAHGGLLGR